jgi:transposase
VWLTAAISVPPECGQTVRKCGRRFFVVHTFAKRYARFVHALAAGFLFRMSYPWRRQYIEAIVKATYSEAFIEQALVKIFSRGDRTVRAVAGDLNVNYHTLKNWMKRESMIENAAPATKEKRPRDWTAEQQLVALHETHGATEEDLQAWCRQRGLFAHHLTSWRTAFCAAGKEAGPGGREVRMLKDEVVKLKRELVRKDQALAEAAALLILQKKFRALWEDEAQ